MRYRTRLWIHLAGRCLHRCIDGAGKPVFAIALGLLFFAFYSCQKTGVFQERDAYFEFRANWYFVYGQVAYDVEIDGIPVAILTEKGFTITVRDADAATTLKHVQVKEQGTGNVLLDTSMTIRGHALTFTQWFADSPLCFGEVPFTETAPDPTDSSSCKYRFTYNSASMASYDSVKLVFYSGNDVYKAYTLSRIDSVVVGKGQWSPWITLQGNPKGYASPVWLFKIYDATADTLLQNITYKTTGSYRGFTKAVGYIGQIQTAARPEYKFKRLTISGGSTGINGRYLFNNYETSKFDVLW